MTSLQPLRLVVMGTGPFAVPMFHALRQSHHRIEAVVTRPDRVAPGRRPPPNPMREAAQAAGVPILAPERINDDDAIDALARLAPDVFVVCDYGQILSPRVLALAPLGGINLHGSLLPRHRGAAPIQWALLEGDPITGVSVIHMTSALDAGAVIVARAAPIYPGDTAPALEAHLADLGAGATLEAIERLDAARAFWKPGEPLEIGVPQDVAKATRAPRLSKADGLVAWTRPAVQIERMRRALEPWPRTTAFLARPASEPLRLVLEDVAVDTDHAGAAAHATPGTILAAGDEGIVVACGGGTALVIRRVVPEGRRGMSVAEFLRGSPVLPGMHFAIQSAP
ncbi:MAG: methionyl-tRNA formyltransferase [Planctomycetia bacterium]